MFATVHKYMGPLTSSIKYNLVPNKMPVNCFMHMACKSHGMGI